MRKILIIVVLFVSILALILFFFHICKSSIVPETMIMDASDKSGGVADSLKKDIVELSSKIGIRNVQNYDNLNKAKKYISNEFEKAGYKLETQEYTVGDKTVCNLIFKKEGTDKSLEPLVIGAHYDTVNVSPGADDNASGIAGILEIAKMISNKKISRDLIIIAFVNEESPYFKNDTMGSKHYADSLRNKEQKIKGAIILDMIGTYSNEPNSQKVSKPLLENSYSTKGDFLLFVGDDESKEFVHDLEGTFEKSCKVPYRETLSYPEETGISDHWSFWVNGYKAVLLTDTVYLRNFNYHTKNDTYENLNYGYMSKVVTGIYEAVFDMVK